MHPARIKNNDTLHSYPAGAGVSHAAPATGPTGAIAMLGGEADENDMRLG